MLPVEKFIEMVKECILDNKNSVVNKQIDKLTEEKYEIGRKLWELERSTFREISEEECENAKKVMSEKYKYKKRDAYLRPHDWGVYYHVLDPDRTKYDEEELSEYQHYYELAIGGYNKQEFEQIPKLKARLKQIDKKITECKKQLATEVDQFDTYADMVIASGIWWDVYFTEATTGTVVSVERDHVIVEWRITFPDKSFLVERTKYSRQIMEFKVGMHCPITCEGWVVGMQVPPVVRRTQEAVTDLIETIDADFRNPIHQSNKIYTEEVMPAIFLHKKNDIEQSGMSEKL